MIIFYKKTTGQIVGTIDARIHTEEHLRMWIGDKEETDRLIVNWKAVRFYDENGKQVERSEMEEGKHYNAEFEPEHTQKELFTQLDKQPSEVYQYKVDLKTKELVK